MATTVKKLTIRVYIDNGVVYEYDVDSPTAAREHADAIVRTGYRHNRGTPAGMIVYPPHRIAKVRVLGVVPTKYPDRVSGT
jgi:hypothetical protein